MRCVLLPAATGLAILIAGCELALSVKPSPRPTPAEVQGATYRPPVPPPPISTPTPLSRIAEGARVSVDPSKWTLVVGEQKPLAASVRLADGQVNANVTWSSSDDTVATVNATTGNVTALRAGVVTIVAAYAVDPQARSMAEITVKADRNGPEPQAPTASATPVPKPPSAIPMRGWTAVTSTMPITAVAIPEYRTLWTVGGTKLVGRSTDGGLNWTQNAVAPEALHVISAVNAQQAWAAGDDGIVYRTEDGGQNWVDLATGQEGAITALRFITAKAGFLVQGERAYATTDGGSSWQALGDVGNYPSPRLLSTSPQQLLIYSRTVPQVFATYKDGIWRHDYLNYGSSPFKAMDFLSANLVYAQTDSGLAISNDAGRTWRLATGPTVSGMHTSIDQVHGLLIGPGGQLMMTVTTTTGIRAIYSSDGGQVWQNAGEQTFTDDGMGRVFDRDRAWSFTAAHGLMRLGH